METASSSTVGALASRSIQQPAEQAALRLPAALQLLEVVHVGGAARTAHGLQRAGPRTAAMETASSAQVSALASRSIQQPAEQAALRLPAALQLLEIVLIGGAASTTHGIQRTGSRTAAMETASSAQVGALASGASSGPPNRPRSDRPPSFSSWRPSGSAAASIAHLLFHCYSIGNDPLGK